MISWLDNKVPKKRRIKKSDLYISSWIEEAKYCGVEDTNISADTSNPDFINPPFPQVVIQISVLEGGVTALIEFVDMGIVMMLIKPAADLAV